MLLHRPQSEERFLTTELYPDDAWFDFWPDLHVITNDSISFGIDSSVDDFPLEINLHGALFGINLQVRLAWPFDQVTTKDGWIRCPTCLYDKTFRV